MSSLPLCAKLAHAVEEDRLCDVEAGGEGKKPVDPVQKAEPRSRPRPAEIVKSKVIVSVSTTQMKLKLTIPLLISFPDRLAHLTFSLFHIDISGANVSSSFFWSSNVSSVSRRIC